MLRCFVIVENWLRGLAVDDEEGATAVEYALMAGIFSVGIIGSFTYFARTVTTEFNKVPQTWPTN
jgi:Flp pilus assembly pilin Flp